MRGRTVLALSVAAAPLLVPGAADAATVWCDGHRATIVGTAAGEVIVGTRGADVIAARGGDDTVDGRGGADRICGGNGADRLAGGPGDDRVFGQLDRILADDEGTARVGDTLRGGPGRDRLVPGRDPRPADDVNPEAIVWDTSPRAIRFDVAAGRAFGDGPDSFVATGAWLVGSRFGDTFDGSARRDLLNGAQGSDVVRAGGGDDQVVADSGAGGTSWADRVWGGPGDDELSSARGRDVVHGGDGADVIDDVGRSADVLTGDGGPDLLVYEMVRSTTPQVLDGGTGRDRLALFSNLLNPTAAPSTGFWEMSTGELELDADGPQAVTAKRIEVADLSTFGAAWTVSGTSGPDRIEVGSMRATTFFGRGGDDVFLGSAFDDVFEGQAGTDRSLGMGAGVDTCRSVEVLDVADCEDLSP